jgi:hypothetical protein
MCLVLAKFTYTRTNCVNNLDFWTALVSFICNSIESADACTTA